MVVPSLLGDPDDPYPDVPLRLSELVLPVASDVLPRPEERPESVMPVVPPEGFELPPVFPDRSYVPLPVPELPVPLELPLVPVP